MTECRERERTAAEAMRNLLDTIQARAELLGCDCQQQSPPPPLLAAPDLAARVLRVVDALQHKAEQSAADGVAAPSLCKRRLS